MLILIIELNLSWLILKILEIPKMPIFRAFSRCPAHENAGKIGEYQNPYRSRDFIENPDKSPNIFILGLLEIGDMDC